MTRTGATGSIVIHGFRRKRQAERDRSTPTSSRRRRPARCPPRRLSGWASGHFQAVTHLFAANSQACFRALRTVLPALGLGSSEDIAVSGLGRGRSSQLPPQPGASFMHLFFRIALAAFRPRVGSRWMPRAPAPLPSWSAALPRDPFFVLCHAIRMCVTVPTKRRLLSASMWTVPR